MMGPRDWSALACVGLAVATPAIAQAAAADDDAKVFEFGIGVGATAGAALLGQPADTQLQVMNAETITYPSFAGWALSAGLLLEARFFRHVGLELGAQYGQDSLSGDVTQGSSTTRVTLDHPTIRIPILLKGILPLGAWSPFVVAGPELTFYGLSETTSEPTAGVRTVASAESSLWWTLGAGVEWKTPLTALDLRVPCSLRFSINPDVEDALGERATVVGSGALILENSAPQFRLGLTAAAALYF